MESSPIGLFLILPIFLIFFFGMWSVMLTLVSVLGGWNSLAKSFPMDSTIAGRVLKSFSFNSVRFSIFGTYSNCINVILTENGILLKPMLLFRFMHKPIFLPWNKIENTERRKILFSTRCTIQVDLKEVQFFGATGDEIHSYYQHFLKA